MKALTKKRITALLALPALLFAAPHVLAQSEEYATPVELFPDFSDFFEQALARDNVPGGVFAVVHRDRILQIQPFGVRAAGSSALVDENTVFRLASVSKTFASGLAAKLQHEQYFQWQDPITQYVPEFRFQNESLANQVTVEHLLAHSVGVVPNAYDNLIEANYNRTRILPHFARLNPLCEPGECYGYQNVLFSFIEPVLEQSTGVDYATLLSTELFNPLGMNNASVGLEQYLAAPNKAAPHVRGQSRWFSRTVTPHYYNFPSAAGVNASAADLAQWLIAQLGYRPDVMPTEVLNDLREPRVRTVRDLRRRGWRNFIQDAHYGLGWRLYQFGEHEIMYHGGWVQGFRADIAYSPEHEVGLVILLNAESNVINDISSQFWADVLPRLEQERWVPYYHASTTRSAETDPEQQRANSVRPDTPLPLLPIQPLGNSSAGAGLLNR